MGTFKVKYSETQIYNSEVIVEARNKKEAEKKVLNWELTKSEKETYYTDFFDTEEKLINKTEEV